MTVSIDLEFNDASYRFTRVHEVKGSVNLMKGHCVGYEFIDHYFPIHIPVNYFGDICASSNAAKSGALPGPPGHELKGAGFNLLARSRYPNND